MTDTAPIRVVNRQTGEIFDEVVMGERFIRWAYQDARAGWVTRMLFGSPLISRVMGWWYDSPLSRRQIAPTIRQLGIDEAEFQQPTASFRSFNDFFVRHLKPEARPFDAGDDAIVSPADGRVLVFPTIEDGTYAPVKGHPFSLHAMLPEVAERFAGGALAIVRLCPADYHRFHYPCAGRVVDRRTVAGDLHSVNPIALGSGPDVFGRNRRAITLIDTRKAGPLAYIEVGAFGVGSIVQTNPARQVAKMDEKGYFKFGGSTVVLVFGRGCVTFSPDLVRNSAAGLETLVKVGETIATIDGGA